MREKGLLSLSKTFFALLATVTIGCLGGCRENRSVSLSQFDAVNPNADLRNIEQTVVLRGAQTILLNAKQGETVRVAMTPRHYGAPVRYAFVAPDGKTVATGELQDKEKSELCFLVAADGTHRLKLFTDNSSIQLAFDERPVAIELPVHLFRSSTTFHFSVPKGVKRFDAYVRGDGSNEYAASTICDADGKQVASGDTAAKDGMNEITKLSVTVPADQAGRVWSIRIHPSGTNYFEDVYLRLSPEIPPRVSLAADTVLCERKTTKETMLATYGPVVETLRTRLRSIPEQNKRASYWKQQLSHKLNRLANTIDTAHTLKERKELDAGLIDLGRLITALQQGKLTFDKCVVRTVKAISNGRIYPNAPCTRGAIDEPLRVTATPGEYESGSFVVTAAEAFHQLHVKTSDLVSSGGNTLPASAIDIKSVKVWYKDSGLFYLEQTPAHTYNPCQRFGIEVLVPELLLHDDSMIRVDLDKAKNYLKLGGPDGTKFVCVSGDETRPEKTKEEFPVYDAKNLRPLAIPAGMNKQFWVTVHIPDNTASGLYTGVLRLTNAGKPLGSLPFTVRVLPFTLAPSRYIAGIYYYPPHPTYYGKDIMKQFRKEMENLYAHSIVDTMLPFNILKNPAALKIRQAVGFTSKTIFYRGWLPVHAKTVDAVRENTAKHVNALRAYGIENVYFYGIDEATGEKLRSQRDSWKAVHEAGGKIFVAGYKKGKDGNFALMGDLQDLLVCSSYPDPGEARRWHGNDHKIICYGNPQSGVEQPDTYRRNYGFLLWQNEYDGLMTYIYHFGATQNWGKPSKIKRCLPNVWIDNRRDTNKQHNMVYPTSNGVVDTMQWEGYREAADDLRYISTLLDLLDSAAASRSRAVRKTARKANAYLADLKERDVNAHRLDMDVLRADIIEHILTMQTALKEAQ